MEYLTGTCNYPLFSVVGGHNQPAQNFKVFHIILKLLLCITASTFTN